MSTGFQVPDAAGDTTLSARLVYAALEGSDSLTVDELTDRTKLSRRSVMAGLRQLRDLDLATADPHPGDHRRRLYSMTDSAEVSL